MSFYDILPSTLGSSCKSFYLFLMIACGDQYYVPLPPVVKALPLTEVTSNITRAIIQDVFLFTVHKKI